MDNLEHVDNYAPEEPKQHVKLYHSYSSSITAFASKNVDICRKQKLSTST